MKYLLRLWLPVLLLPLLGCGGGDNRKPTYAVAGKVADASGRPLANADVVFHPVDDGGDGTLRPYGRTDETGTFRLTTYDGNDGAPAGQYRVSVQQWKTVSADGGPTNQLPSKYANPDQSGLTATVNPGPTDLRPFQIRK